MSASTPPGRRRSVDEVAAPYENFLVPVPISASDVCSVCHSVVEGWPECFKRHEAITILGSGAADAVAFVSLAPNTEQMGRELFSYKNLRTPERLRAQKTAGLAAVLWKWLNRHEACLARQVGIERFDLITTVRARAAGPPTRSSTSSRVSSRTQPSDTRTCSPSTGRTYPRRCAPDRYACHTALFGQYVLVIDDTWTTGAHAQSASAAVKAAGAAGAGIVAIGRWVTPDYRDHGAWLALHRTTGWVWSRCCLEAGPH